MVVTFGHQAAIRHIEETTPGTTPANPALVLFSKETRRVRLHLDKQAKEALDIGQVTVDEHFTVQNAYGVEVEFVVYSVDVVEKFLDRKSTGEPRSFTLELIPNVDATTPHYIRGTGWRPQTVRLTGRLDDAWMCAVTFTGGKWSAPTTTDPGIGSGSRQAKSAISDARRTFASGAITLNAGAWALLLGEFEAVIEHGSEPQYTTGDAEPVAAGSTHGKRKYTGRCSFALEDGAKPHWDRVSAFATHTIVVPFGAAGQPKLTWTNVRFPRAEVELAADRDHLFGDQPWVATTLAKGTV